MDYTINKGIPLSQEQNEIIDFMRRRAVSINGAGTGLGKTYSTLTLAVHFMTKHPEYRCVILCPNKANKAFIRELTTKLFEPYSIYTADGSKVDKKSRFFIFNYSSLHKFYETIIDIKGDQQIFFIIDEAHTLSNPSSFLYKTVRMILRLGKIRWGLTATPLGNDLEGMFHMVDLLKPGFLGPSIEWFKHRYEIIELKDMQTRGKKVKIPQVVGYQNLAELNAKMQDICIIRKLPFNLHFDYIKFPMEETTAAAYKKASKGLEYDRTIVDKTTKSEYKVRDTREWGARLHDLQQILDNCHSTLDGVSFSNKEKEMCKLIRKVNSEGGCTLIYCEYYNTIDRVEYVLTKLKAKLEISKIFKITGKQKINDRAQVEDKMIPNSVVIVSKAGNESVNLQKSNHVIFYDLPFAINDVIQMVGRVARMDSKFSDMYVHFLEYEDTLDTYKRLRIQQHSTLIDNVICHDTNLPLEVLVLDSQSLKDIKKKYIWKFKH